MLPSITIVGNTTGPAEVRFTQSGTAVANLTVVSNRRRKNDAGEWEDNGRSPFLNIAVWGEDAEAIADAITGPAKVVVTGQLLAREYERRDGTKGESMDLEYATVGIVPTARTAQRQGNGYAYGQQHGGQQRSGQQAQQQDPWATQPQGQDPWATPGNAGEQPPY